MAVSDLDFADYAALCHAFTIGGTKNGLLFGEALVITDPLLMPSFRRCMKQQGAMLAKGRLLGVQYAAVLENDLYRKLAQQGADMAKLLTDGLKALQIPMLIQSPSNQIFPILPNAVIEQLKQSVSFEHWSSVSDTHSCIRFVTAWHTTKEEVEALLSLLGELMR
jgi:threonine aldolase